MAVNPTSQHMAALENANRIRLARAAIGREVAALGRDEGRLRAAEIVLDPPAVMEGQTVFKLLAKIRRVGRHQAMRWIHQAGITESKTIGSLTPRQRGVVAEVLQRCWHKQSKVDECALCANRRGQ